VEYEKWLERNIQKVSRFLHPVFPIYTRYLSSSTFIFLPSLSFLPSFIHSPPSFTPFFHLLPSSLFFLPSLLKLHYSLFLRDMKGIHFFLSPLPPIFSFDF
jgi:hypothetical protein